MINISDPVYREIENPNFFDRLAMALISDKRDLPFIHLIAQILIFVIPFACIFYSMKSPHWALFLCYWALTIGYFLGPVVLMLHNTSHRRLFRPQYRALQHLIPWVIGPFFGETPETYYAHHIGMHHVEENLPDDLSTTMRFQRDSFIDFLNYFFSFFLFGFPRLLRYLKTKRRSKLYLRAFVGEISFYLVVGTLFFLNWQATVVVFVVPFVAVRFGMMAGNWAQHAFIDRDDAANPFRNSITCINSTYNRRCFNDGYHIGHHVQSNRHWTEMPGDFLKNVDRYAENKSVVFRSLDYFGIWLLLMLKQYDRLAKYFVCIGKTQLSQSEIVSLLKSRTLKIPIARSVFEDEYDVAAILPLPAASNAK